MTAKKRKQQQDEHSEYLALDILQTVKAIEIVSATFAIIKCCNDIRTPETIETIVNTTLKEAEQASGIQSDHLSHPTDKDTALAVITEYSSRLDRQLRNLLGKVVDMEEEQCATVR